MKIKGKVHLYGDDINTDVIFPGRYLNITDPKEMAEHAMEDLDAEFIKKVSPGDIIVAGKNFGCGSSREQAATCLKEAGISAIVALSFARIFYRNAINQGLPILTLKEIEGNFTSGDILEIELENGKIKNLTSGKEFYAKPLKGFVLDIIKNGGLIPHLKKALRS